MTNMNILHAISFIFLVHTLKANHHQLGVKNLGCWIRDQQNIPAISSFEKQNRHVMDSYWLRMDPVTACAKAAAAEGFNVFAVSNRGFARGGECFTSCSAAKDFAKFGKWKAKCAEGTGGYLSMDVYSLDVTVHLGCIKNSMSGYAIPDMEGSHLALFGQPHHRENAVEKCAAVARSKGYTVFGITKGGRCLASGDAYKRYTALSSTSGSGINCEDGKGSEHSISVHLIVGLTEFEEPINNSGRRRNNVARRQRKRE